MAVILLGLAAIFGTNLHHSGLVYAIMSGAVTSGLGYTIWYAALPGLSPAQGASVQLSVPVITALAGTIALGEAITIRLSLSSLAVLGGIALVIASRERRSQLVQLIHRTGKRSIFEAGSTPAWTACPGHRTGPTGMSLSTMTGRPTARTIKTASEAVSS